MPAPDPVGTAHVHLHERAGQLILLPGRGAFTGAQPQHHVTGALGIARSHRHVATFAIALVEQADHRDALRHRRHARRGGDSAVRIDRLDVAARRFGQDLLDPVTAGQRRAAVLIGAPAEPAANRQRHGHQGRGDPANHPSGVQAS